jgi:tetratricopeptide (TPR) repeat protein
MQISALTMVAMRIVLNSRTISVRLAAAGSILALCLLQSALAQMQMPACHAMPTPAEIVAPANLPAPQKLTGIGNLHFPISSHNPETQAWFDQGINMVFDFWDYEANRAFEQAIRTDPDCAICHWGLAESLGIHNGEVEGYAHEELMKAVALRSHANKREQMYIDAAQAEGAEDPDAKGAKSKKNASAEAILRKIVQKYPQDETAQLMLSEEVGAGYDDDGKPRKGTEESMAILQAILKQTPDSSAANHLWIHAVEASPHPEQALHSANVLATLAPASGHMTHMPGHIFYRTGNYERAQVSFDLSQSVDETYMQSQHISADDDWNYVHNLMYSIANLLESGRMTEAAVVSNKLTAARGARAATLYPWSTRDSISRLSPLLPLALRSGDWERVQALSSAAAPPASFPNLQALATSLTTFANGMISVNNNHLDEARKDSAELDAELWRISQQVEEQNAATEKAKPKEPAKPENHAQPTDPMLPSLLKNLAILSLELRAAILIPSGKLPEAKALFAQARREERALGYREPPAFIRPVAEQEAELLMNAGDTTEAEKALHLALDDRPNSGFPLYGLALLAEKSGNTQQTDAAYDHFLTAWKGADPELPQIKHAQQWAKDHPKQALTLQNQPLQPNGGK